MMTTTAKSAFWLLAGLALATPAGAQNYADPARSPKRAGGGYMIAVPTQPSATPFRNPLSQPIPPAASADQSNRRRNLPATSPNR